MLRSRNFLFVERNREYTADRLWYAFVTAQGNDFYEKQMDRKKHYSIFPSENKNKTFFIKRTQHLICNHLTESPSQMLTNRPCCVLSYAPSLYWQRKNIPTNANSGGDQTSQPRCCVSAYISVVILTPSLKPSMKASFSDRAISDN